LIGNLNFNSGSFSKINSYTFFPRCNTSGARRGKGDIFGSKNCCHMCVI
jgi:hypothetical protein